MQEGREFGVVVQAGTLRRREDNVHHHRSVEHAPFEHCSCGFVRTDEGRPRERVAQTSVSKTGASEGSE